MILRSLIGAICLLFTFQASAQIYSGPVAITLSSEGTSAQTTVTSSAWVARFTPSTGQLSLMVKTPVLGLDQDPAVQQRLQTVLLTDANPLMVINIDLSALAISPDVLASHDTQSFPALIQFNGTRHEQTVDISLMTQKDGLTLDLDAVLSLQAFGLPLPEAEASAFADLFQLSAAGIFIPLH